MSSSSRPRNFAEAARHAPGDGSVRAKRKKLSDEIALAGQAETPYGCVTKTLTIGEVAVPFICTFALIFSLCDKSLCFAAFLHNCIQGQVGRIAIYVDEVVPGNALRPDPGRAFYAWFWTILEWPDWYRSRKAGWFDLCVMKAKDVAAIPGGVSAIAVHILKMFWDPTCLMHMENLGIRLAGPRGPWILRAKFVLWLMDERAEKFITSCKGSSGSKPCISCRNCVGRIGPADVSQGFMHFSEPGLDGFEPNTYETFSNDLEWLALQHGAVTKGRFDLMQQALGIVYDPLSLPMSDMRGCARIPDTRFCDWMHNLCASGGVIQYHINAFCIAVVNIEDVEEQMSLENLDEFQRRVNVPSSHTKLDKKYFQNRTSTNPETHIKGFAGEVLSIVAILQLFCTIVLVPVGGLPQHVSLMQQAFELLQLLRMGDAVVGHVDRLREVCLRYHTAFLDLMPNSVKPKMHYLHHTAQQVARHRINLSCFAPERKHKFNKQCCNFIYNNMEIALCRRNADEMLRLAQQEETFSPIHLVGHSRSANAMDIGAMQLQEKFGRNVFKQTNRSCEIKTPWGALHRGDLCMWLDHHTRRRMGFIEYAYSITLHGCWVLVGVCTQDGASWQRSMRLELVEASMVRGSLLYYQHDNGAITPQLPLEI